MNIAPIDAPRAASPRYGLLASFADRETEASARWMQPDTVIEYKPEGCVEGRTVEMCDPGPAEPPVNPPLVQWHAYGLEVSLECSTWGGDTIPPEIQARALRLLNADRERQLGSELWLGTLAQTATLADGTTPWPNTWLANMDDLTEIDSGTPVGYVRALACLEQALAYNNSGQQGVIHASAQVVTHWESFRLLRRDKNRIYTMQDNIVVVSPGYPSAVSPSYTDEVWAFATDVPRIFLGEPHVSKAMDSVDYRNNTVTVVAFQPGLVEWQRCRHFGVQLAITPCGGTDG